MTAADELKKMAARMEREVEKSRLKADDYEGWYAGRAFEKAAAMLTRRAARLEKEERARDKTETLLDTLCACGHRYGDHSDGDTGPIKTTLLIAWLLMRARRRRIERERKVGR